MNDEQRAAIEALAPKVRDATIALMKGATRAERFGLVSIYVIDQGCSIYSNLDGTSTHRVLRSFFADGNADLDKLTDAAIAVVSKLLWAHEDRSPSEAREIAAQMLKAEVLRDDDDDEPATPGPAVSAGPDDAPTH